MDEEEARNARAYIEFGARMALSNLAKEIKALRASRSISDQFMVDIDLMIGSVDELDLSERTASCLARKGIVLIVELLNYTEYDLLALIHFSQACLDEVNTKLAKRGLSLRESVPVTSRSIESLQFSTRVQYLLYRGVMNYSTAERMPILTVEQLVRYGPDDLMSIPGFGRASLAEVKQVLARNNLSLLDS